MPSKLIIYFISCEQNEEQYRNIKLGIISPERVEEIKYLQQHYQIKIDSAEINSRLN